MRFDAFGTIGRTCASWSDRALAKASALSPQAARFAGGRLLKQLRFQEAEALLGIAAAAFPEHVGVQSRYAFTAEVDNRFAEGAKRWGVVCGLRPDSATAWRGLAKCQRYLGDIPGATSSAATALGMKPNDWRIQMEAARVHDRADRDREAEKIWAPLAARRPDDPLCRQGYADCLVRLDRLEEAERQIEAGLRRHPDHGGLLAAKGLLAMRHQNWEEAFAIWSRYVAAHPTDETGHNFLSRITLVQQLADAEAQGQPPQLLAPIAVERVEDEAIRLLMLRFEGIGTDCEFGTVQRRYGAEPLGLLRWSDVNFASLATALEARFAEMGNPDRTEFATGDIGELYVRDKRWGLGMHTFLNTREVSLDALFPKMCRRIVYLRDKLISDLEAADKILVYKTNDITFAELGRLHALLRTYGPVRLLHVRTAAFAGIPPWPAGEPGTIAAIAPDLFVGYVPRINNLFNVCFDEWVEVCRAIAARVDDAATVGTKSARRDLASREVLS